MANVQTHPRSASSPVQRVRPPSVLIVLVTRDAAAWLRRCLVSISRQTHPRIGVLAIDKGSADGSAEILESAIGPERVIRSGSEGGLAGAVAEALRSPAAQQADYLLLLHDDTALAPDAVAGLVETAERIEGAAVVGPKVTDWDEPRVLKEIGQSTDRFGYAYSPLEEGEIDQGQYERVREVLFVTSCAMLVSRRAFERIGLPDERLGPNHEDLDFCWRARMAGYRVLMTPRAVVHHRGGGGARGTEGPMHGDPARSRYRRERAALACILKNYGALSLLWMLPLHLAQGAARTILLLASRRFEDSYQILAAWGWNVTHLPGTLRRRVQAQAVRSVPDRDVRRYMAPAGIRLRRWASAAAQLVLPGRAVEGESQAVPLRVRAVRFAMRHPVASSWMVGALLALVAYRHLFGASPLLGGGLAQTPASAGGYLAELFSGLRHTGLGGAQAASPALGMLGLGSLLAFDSPALLQKVLLLALPAAAAVGCYRAVRTLTRAALPAATAGVCYALSASMLWAVSEGRVPVLVVMAALPWLVLKLGQAFGARLAGSPLRWVVGAGIGIAILSSFYPATLLAVGVLAISALAVPASGGGRTRGAILVTAALGVGLLLALPVAQALAGAGGAALADRAGEPSFFDLLRLSLGPAPGSWAAAYFLPAAAGLGLLFVTGSAARLASRLAIAALGSVYLAWLAGAGHLPEALSNPVAYVAVAAACYAIMLGIGVAGIVEGMGRASFGHVQVGAAAMALLVGAGIAAQVSQAAGGDWQVGGPEHSPVAYPAVSEAGGPDFRVLWLGAWDGDDFPAPGGLPDGRVAAGRASVRYAVTGREGDSALDVGRAAWGPGYDALGRSLSAILSGRARHGGAALGPFGIRFIVASPRDLPTAAFQRLDQQLDLDVVPAQGLTIFQNANWLAPAVSTSSNWLRAARSSGSGAVSALSRPGFRPLIASDDRWTRLLISEPLVVLSQQFDHRWRLSSGRRTLRPFPAFGWAVGFSDPPSRSYAVVRFEGQGTRTAQMWFLAVLWVAALWITGRPVRG